MKYYTHIHTHKLQKTLAEPIKTLQSDSLNYMHILVHTVMQKEEIQEQRDARWGKRTVLRASTNITGMYMNIIGACPDMKIVRLPKK